MNAEYALIQLLIRDPKRISELAVKGFSSKYFKKKEYGKAYDIIFDRFARFASSPTAEDLAPTKVKIETEDIPQTLEHCVAVMFEDKVKELLQKAIIASGEELMQNGPEASMDLMRQAINGIPRLDGERRSRDLSETSDAFLERFHNRAMNKGKILGLEMGFPEIDKHVRGLMPQWLTVIMGRNGQYKSWVLSHMIKTAFLNKKSIMVFSCEMSLEEFENRIYSLALNVPPRAIDLGEMPYNEDYTRMQEFSAKVKNNELGRLVINDNPADLDMIAMEIDNYRQKYDLDVVFIDAVYGLNAPGKSDVERFNYLAKGCKALAKKIDLPVVVTIQANREFAKANTTAKKDTTGGGMSAYGGDGWNQYADLMFLIHRTPDHEPFHFSEFIMDKFRHGPKYDAMLRINLKEPIICETNREAALARINGENPQAQTQSDRIFDKTTQLFKKTDLTDETVQFGDDADDVDAA